MAPPEKTTSNWVTIGIVMIIGLLGLNGWLLYDRFQSKQEIQELTSELDESENLARELEKQYYETLSQLEEMRSDNTEMNALIDQQKNEIKRQKDEIDRMIRTTKDYSAIKQRMAQLESKAEEYLAELDALREQNQMLEEANLQLSQEKRSLEQTLQETTRQVEDLAADKSALSADKSRLESQNVALGSKVNQASVVPIKHIDVTGFQLSKSGKESKKRYASNIDRLRICFDADANPVTDPGMEKFFIRVISPIGQTITMEETGDSGILTTADGDQVRFSFTKEMDYNRAAQQVCINWEPGVTFDKGNYQVEVYNKGYMAGAGTFRLR
jgi:hypothetical protein